jgi:hypothetical protein
MRTWLTMAALSIAIVSCNSAQPEAPGPSRSAPSNSPAASLLPQGADKVTLDPARFQTTIDHRYWPMAPGATWVYREATEDGPQRVEVTVTDRKKEILGIQATVVHDVVSIDGEVIEDTFDWYAQDSSGNLWYLGEDTKEYEEGKVVSTEGSWEAGVDGAQAGIILPADPAVGMTYRQEYYKGHAEDAARILSLDEQAETPFGHFTGVMLTKDLNPLEPKLLEYKFYARDVGPVLAIAASGGTDREELVSYKR